ncbi:MAG: hypothetical protein R3C52_04215 [Hyphomonadaceae bacterium]
MANNIPTHVLYVVTGDGEKKRWTEIGAAWPHKNGGGFNLNLEALPPTGKIVMRPAKSQSEQGGAQ